jgi:release factor glutamine methyltransferase
MERWTIQKLLNWITEFFTQKGVDSPRLSGELLLSHVLKLSRIELYTLFDRVVEPISSTSFAAWSNAAATTNRWPISSAGANFIPCRSKSHRIALSQAGNGVTRRTRHRIPAKTYRTQQVLDLCTGSGCIAIAIAKNYKDCLVTATDICDKALAIAAENAAAMKLSDKIRYLCGDLFAPSSKASNPNST